MMDRTARKSSSLRRRWLPTPSLLVAAAALFIALGGSAVAANHLIHTKDIAAGAVTSKTIKNGTVQPIDLSKKTRGLIRRGGTAGAQGDTGLAGTNGVSGINGANGPNGANGANGANGPNGANGVDGTEGEDGTDGLNGTNGTNGTIEPLSATQGLTALPTASPPTSVVSLTVPAGNYVVLAKTQLSHTGAGDTVMCELKSGATALDQISMKTLPALAAIPASLQAVTTTESSTLLSVECDVTTANGSADFNSLIAIPTG